MKRTLLSATLAAAAALLTAASAARAETFAIDPVHSSIIFKVQHNGISHVIGRFNDFSGTINYDQADPAKTTVDFTVKTASVDTGNAKRDGHLQGPDFFNAKQFPVATFKSTAVKAEGKELDITGNFSLRGVTKPVTLDAEFTGTTSGEEIRAGGEGEFTLKRSDYGITYGTPKVGDEVEIKIYLQGVKQ